MDVRMLEVEGAGSARERWRINDVALIKNPGENR
jgi:hypothetical protein